MMTEEENQLISRVEGDAPMGQLMRRHWQAVCLSEEVPEPDGAPVRARVLGEDLVVFKDTLGLVGVMGEFCPHRGVSLVYGRNEHGGLRCLYHGWKMSVSGEVLEMSSEPSLSSLPGKVQHTAYPALEWGGFVWCYMGAKDTFTPFTPPPWAPNEHVRVSICKMIIPCNWAQILEGQIDSAHSSSLHSSDMMPARLNGAFADDKTWLRPSTDKAPRMQAQIEPYGFRYVAIRRPIEKASTHDYVRCTVFLAPASALIPPNNAYNVANINTAVDDTHTAFHFIAWGDAATTPDTQAWRAFLHTQKGVDVDEQYHPIRNVQNHFLQDRQAMKAGNYTGIQGIPNQDLSMWVTMGAITKRSHDRLGASDLAIVEFRKQMLHEVQAFARGEAPIGVGRRQAPLSTCSFQASVEKSSQWQHHEAQPV